MHLVLPTKFSQEEGTVRAKQALEEARPHIAGKVSIEKEEWHDSTLNFTVALQGKEVSGRLEVKDKEFVLDATLPLLWRMFEGKIERAISEEVAKRAQ